MIFRFLFHDARRAGWVAAGLRICLALVVLGSSASSAATPEATETTSWWKGNLHTHTLWSDGDDYPESVVAWYQTNGYHFLALTDHNILQSVVKWVSIEKNKGGRSAFDRYLGVYGRPWVVTRETESGSQVRLKTLDEFRPRFEAPGRFLLLAGEELSDRHKVLPLHLNAYNLREFIPPQGGTSVVDVLQRNVDAVLEQRKRTGQLMVPHVNHPNFGYGVTAEELMQIRGERFFEVYNGHPDVHNEGDAHHPGTERMWDIMLAFRLTTLNLDILYGLAVDDSHAYHAMSPTNSNPGRGWIMVRSPDWLPKACFRHWSPATFTVRPA